MDVILMERINDEDLMVLGTYCSNKSDCFQRHCQPPVASVKGRSRCSGLKRKFYDLCYRLGVGAKYADSVWLKYNDMKSINVLDGDQLHWLVCLLFVDSRGRSQDNFCHYDEQEKTECTEIIPKPSLTLLLRLSKLEPHRFFDLCRRHVISEFELSIVNEIERSYQVGVVLGLKFPVVFETVFDLNNNDDSFDTIQRFSWLLFCWLRCLPFARPEDLVHSFCLMLALHELLFKAALSAGLVDLIRPELESSSTVDLLYFLCDRFQANYEMAKGMLESSIEPAIDELTENLKEPLLENVKFNEGCVRSMYHNLLQNADQLDECYYREQNDSLDFRITEEEDGGDADESWVEVTSQFTRHSTMRKLLSMYSSARTKLDSVGLRKNWESEMTAILHDNYDKNMADFEKCRRLTLIIMWQLVCTDNEHFLNEQEEHECLLMNPMFIRTLFECALILINYWNTDATNDEQNMPSILSAPAFYAYSVIQPVVRALLTVGLSRDAATHLLAVQAAILEEGLFVDDSPLWERMRKTPMDETGRATNRPSTSQQLITAKISVLRRNGSRMVVKVDSMSLLMTKLLEHAAKRLDDLCCGQLGQRELTSRQCWFLMNHILTKDLEFLRNRHLDQVMMCIVYAICKSFAQPLSFQQIIKAYSTMGGRVQTFKKVRMDDHKRFANIIDFYNEVFVARYKMDICNFLRDQITTKNSVAFGLSTLDLPALPCYGAAPCSRSIITSPLKYSPRYSPFLSPRKNHHLSGTLYSYKSTVDQSVAGRQGDLSNLKVAFEVSGQNRKRTRVSEQSEEHVDESIQPQPCKRERREGDDTGHEGPSKRAFRCLKRRSEEDVSVIVDNVAIEHNAHSMITRRSKRVKYF